MMLTNHLSRERPHYMGGWLQRARSTTKLAHMSSPSLMMTAKPATRATMAGKDSLLNGAKDLEGERQTNRQSRRTDGQAETTERRMNLKPLHFVRHKRRSSKNYPKSCRIYIGVQTAV